MKRWIPTRETLRQSRWLGPLAHRLDDDRLWRLERSSVALAVAIGLFFGLLIPFAQFLFAVGTAVALRAHVAIAAACTLVTNPLTFAPIYWAAFKLGSLILDRHDVDSAANQVEAEARVLADQTAPIEGLWATLQSAGAPLFVGLALMATVAAVLGYVLVSLLWRDRRKAS
jgi:uncharacterized protein (DUF2062 family)